MCSAVFPTLFAQKPSVRTECEVIEWTDEQATVTPNRSALYDPPFQGWEGDLLQSEVPLSQARSPDLPRRPRH